MKDHIVNKKELKKRLEAVGWPNATGRSLVPTLDEIVRQLDQFNDRSPQRRHMYTMVMVDQQGEHYTRNIIVPYTEPAVVQGLVAEHHILSAEMEVLGSAVNSEFERNLVLAKMNAIRDMLENGIDTTPFDI